MLNIEFISPVRQTFFKIYIHSYFAIRTFEHVNNHVSVMKQIPFLMSNNWIFSIYFKRIVYITRVINSSFITRVMLYQTLNAGTTFDTIPRFNTSMTLLSRSVYTFKEQYTPYIWDTNIPIQGHQTIIIISYVLKMWTSFQSKLLKITQYSSPIQWLPWSFPALRSHCDNKIAQGVCMDNLTC